MSGGKLKCTSSETPPVAHTVHAFSVAAKSSLRGFFLAYSVQVLYSSEFCIQHPLKGSKMIFRNNCCR